MRKILNSILLFSAFTLTGCGVNAISNPISGAASMRIEVEVYKGPLSKDVDIQWSELKAAIDEARTSLATFDDEVLRIASIEGYLNEAVRPISIVYRENGQVLNDIHNVEGHLFKLERRLPEIKRLLEKIGTKEGQDALIDATEYLDVSNDAFKEMEIEFGKLVKKAHSKPSKYDPLDEDTAREKAGIFSKNLIALCNELIVIKTSLSMGATPKGAENQQLLEKTNKLLEKATKELSDFAVSLKELIKVPSSLLLRAKERDFYGPMTVQPMFRGNKRRNDRVNTPSRTVSKIYGREVNSSNSELFWCNRDEFRNAWGGKNPGFDNTTGGSGCLRLALLHDEVDHLHRIIQNLQELAYESKQHKLTKSLTEISENGKLVAYLAKAGEIGARLRIKAFQWATHLRAYPENRTTRTMITIFANMASELGNQISTRSDAILKQCPTDNGKRTCNDFIARGLPLSIYLRDTNPTGFSNLFTYNRSGQLASVEETLSRPIWDLGTEENTDRARVIESLHADHNWSKINTVYASGQGNVNMAFIKDNLGNWNLKNFKSDPTDLLAAYKKITQAAVKTAVDLAKSGSSGGMETALAVAGRFATGRVSPPTNSVAGVDLSRLSDAVAAQIKDVIARATKKANDEENKTPGNLNKIRKETLDEIGALLSYHDRTLESLQSAVVTSETGGSSSKTDMDVKKQAEGLLSSN